MDQHPDLNDLVSEFRKILSDQKVESLRVLPRSIAPLPAEVTKLSESTPAEPLSHLQDLLQTHVLPYLNGSSLSPNYYGFVIGGATPAALLADWLVSVYDQNVQVHLPAETIATNIEVAALQLLVQLFNLPSEWDVGGKGGGGGTFTTGATASNVLGLALGREWVVAQALRRTKASDSGVTCENSVVSVGEAGLLESCIAAGISSIQILSTMPHSSIGKAASILGIGRSNIVSIAKEHNSDTDDALSIDLSKFEHLAKTMHNDRKAYILAISSGEVNTGQFATTSLSTMQHLREICDEHGIWIHVDGAFGLFARLLPPNTKEYEKLTCGVTGLEFADSITGDGHKLLNVPYDAGIFFTRHKTLSEAVFRNGNAAYLTPAKTAQPSTIQSPLNIGIENSRRFRALPVWATLHAYGRQGYLDLLVRQISLARRIARYVFRNPSLELLPKTSSLEDSIARTFIVVLFRARDEIVNHDLVKRIKTSGRMYVTGTVWEGEPAARIAVANWQVDVERDGRLVEEVIGQAVSSTVKQEETSET